MKNIETHQIHSSWKDASKRETYPPLHKSLDTDICIIGGGLTGLLTAYLLFKSGKKVAVLEKNEIGSGATGLTTAFLTASIDTDFADLIRLFGPDGAKEIIDSHMSAIDLIEKISKEENIECDFVRCPNRAYATTEKEYSNLDEECDAALILGLKATLIKDGSHLGFKNHGYMEIGNQAKYHPLKFLYGLAQVMKSGGAHIYEHTEATKIDKEESGHSVKALGFAVKAKWVVAATYEPYHEPLRLYFKKGMYKTYVIEASTSADIPEGIYEDMKNPYHYMRIDKSGPATRIIAGGEDHREDIPLSEEKSFNALKDYLTDLFPDVNLDFKKKWVGPILEPVDGLAFIGPIENTGNVIYCFAFSGNGMTYAAISAMLALDYIGNKENPWQVLYRTSRLPRLRALLTKGKDYTEELIRGAVKNALRKSKGRLKDVLPKIDEEDSLD